MATTAAPPTAVTSTAPSLGAILGLEPSAAIDRAATAALVKAGAYFSLFSVPNPASPNQPVPLIPQLGTETPLWIAFKVSEALHRFDVNEHVPTPNCGLRLRQAYSSQSTVARVSLEMVPMPNYFEAASDRTPAPTLLLPFLAQRFMPRDGSIHFDDAAQSGLDAEGAGHTYPTPGSQPRLIAVLNELRGFGKLAGKHATGIVSGGITPPFAFNFSVLFRVVDPSGDLRARVPPGPIPAPADPTPQTQTNRGTTFIQVISEEDPAHPITIEPAADGKTARMTVTEKLRLVSLNFNVDPPGLRSVTTVGAEVGRHRTTLVLNLSEAGGTEAGGVVPAYSQGDEFTFFDSAGRSIGGFEADTTEARLLPTVEAGGAMLRLGGYALPTRGSGQFINPVGQVSINGALSPVTGTVSTLYIIRLEVPDAVFKVVT